MAKSNTSKKKPTKARQILEPQDDSMIDPQEIGLEGTEEKKPTHSRRGAKPLSAEKPKGSFRVLFEQEEKVKTTRPVTIYLERVTDADTGKTGVFIWYHNEKSQTIGREEISRINPRTEQEYTLGYDFTIPFSKRVVQELINQSFVRTKWCHKDGRNRTKIDNPKELLEIGES